MEFGNLNYLWLLLMIPALVIFYVFAFRRKQKAMERFAQIELLEQLTLSVSKGKQKAKAALLIAAVLFITLSLIEPKFGYHWEEVKRKGVDIVLLLDTSKSMLAADVLPNRLSAAKREISDLLNIVETKGDRVGLVAFAGTAFIQCPLTLDYGAFRMFLDDVDINTIPQGGTDIGRAIRKGSEAFEGKVKKHKVMILITDGEDHAGVDPDSKKQMAVAAAERAKQNGIVIYTVGVGTRAGEYIWITNEKGRRERLKDKEGKFVKSRLGEKTLAKIALATGGKSTRADSQDWPLEKIYTEAIQKMEKKELGSRRIRRYENRYQWPLSVALLLITIEAIMSERRTQRRRESARTEESGPANSRLLALLLPCFLFFYLASDSLLREAAADALSKKTREANKLFHQGKYDEALSKYADAQLESPESKVLYFNIGDAQYRKEKYDEAISFFQKALATTDIVLEAKANYNIGNAFYRQGNLQLAIVYYRAVKELLGIEKEKTGRGVWEDAAYNEEFGEQGRKVWEDAKANCEFVQRKMLEIVSKRMPDYLAVTPANPVVIVGEDIKLTAAGYRFGKNKKKDGVNEDGKPKGDDIGPIPIEAHWTTDAPERIGAIDAESGVFKAGDAVGAATVSAQDRTQGHFPRRASAAIQVITPDRLEISTSSAVITVGSAVNLTAEAYSNGPDGAPDSKDESPHDGADSQKHDSKSDAPPPRKGDDIGPLPITVEWTIDSGQDLGVIEPQKGEFTAGRKEGKVVIAARPTNPACKDISAAVELTIVRPDYLRVAPAEAAVPSGAKLPFFARAYSKGPDGKINDVDPTGKPLGDDYGPFDVEVKWSLKAPENVGSIDAHSGLFTAGKEQGEAEIVASSKAKDMELEDAKATVHVVSLDYIRIVPPQAKLGLNDRKQFTAQGFNFGPDGKPNEVNEKGEAKGDDLGPFPIDVEWSTDLPGDVAVIDKKSGLLRSQRRPGKGKVSAVTVGAGATLGASAEVEIEDKEKEGEKKKQPQKRPQPKPRPQQQQQRQQKQEKKKMSKKEAEQLLQALLSDEKNQRKLRRARQGRYQAVEKDW